MDDAHDNGALATEFVLVTVAVVIDHEETVGDESHSDACCEKGITPLTLGHDIVGEDDGDKPEEDKDKEIAQAEIGETGGVEKTENHTEEADQEQDDASLEAFWSDGADNRREIKLMRFRSRHVDEGGEVVTHSKDEDDETDQTGKDCGEEDAPAHG